MTYINYNSMAATVDKSQCLMQFSYMTYTFFLIIFMYIYTQYINEMTHHIDDVKITLIIKIIIIYY